jgi:sensor histidine kinase YesM
MSVELIIQNLRNRRAGRLALHIMLWLFYLAAIYYLESISFNNNKGFYAIVEPLKSIVTSMLIYYPLVYLVWPQYLLKKKYLLGGLLILVLIILYAIANYGLESMILESCNSCLEKIKLEQQGFYKLLHRGALNVIIVQLLSLGIIYQLFVFLAFPMAVKIFVEYFDQRIKSLQLQQENMQLEFNFLKAQVNPHFLFNTLNNIYALILKGEKEASAETVAKLAGFMRYSLYESGGQSNIIKKEIDLLKTYIELEQVRLNDTVVNFIDTIDNDHYAIPPLLFMPAVENAFKYCTHTSGGDAYIFLKLDIEKYRLAFVISNTFDKTKHLATTYGGIGLQNLQKRLNHYYPGNRSSMKITQDHSLFQITIQLNLA